MDAPSLLELDRQYIWHPYTNMKLHPPSLAITGAKDALLFSDDGTSYIDAISSWWVNLHGHGHKKLIEAISQQALVCDHIGFADCTHQPAVEYAKKLLEVLPQNMSKIFYSDNGSTAVEVALKMALHYWQIVGEQRITIISFLGAYHGDTFGSMSSSGKNVFNKPFWSHLFEVVQIPPPTKGSEQASLECARNLIKKTDKPCCCIYEPIVQGAGGMITHSPKALGKILSMFQRAGVLCIADEVMTGFGRLGPLFASDMISHKPDIICLSKGITGGILPLAVTACTERIYQAFHNQDPVHTFLHGHSYTANAIACQAALASLELLVTQECSAQRGMIEALHSDFAKSHKRNPSVRRMEVIGTILVVEYATQEDSSYNNSLRYQLFSFFLKHHVLVRPLGNVLYIMPPYCIRQDQLQHIYSVLKASFTLISRL